MTFYAAKTVFRLQRASGSGASALEERVVLLDAEDAEDALRQAEAGALAHESDLVWKNSEGEEIRGRYLKSCEVFELADELGVGAELYSSTVLLRENLEDDALVERVFGPEPTDEVDDLLTELEPDPGAMLA